MRTSVTDIYNERQLYKQEKLGGLTPVQALLRDLEVFNETKNCDNEKYVIEYTLDSDNRVDFLFFSHPLSLAMLRKNYEVLLIDATYKTNKYRMPLLHVSGRDGLNRSFDVAFAFMKGETTADYLKALLPLANIYESISKHPLSIATDFEKSLRSACKHYWIGTPQIICAWHMNKNVLARAKLTWNERVTEDNGDEKKRVIEKRDQFMSS